MKQYEIERRYLLYPCGVRRWLKGLGVAWESLPVRQFYTVAEEGLSERYRQVGNRYYFTRKQGSGLKRMEEEKRIDARLFESAWRKKVGAAIKKRRYRFEWEGRIYELDRFEGRLRGLVILETEFDDEASAKAFVLPKPFERVVAEEITDNPRYSNGALAVAGSLPAHGQVRMAQKSDAFKAAVSLNFGPFTPANEVLTSLITGLTERVLRNREAILAGDEDPERLHQLRVGMRKIRALLSVASSLFNKKWASEAKARLKAQMGPTGEKRDLDVHLARMADYRRLLPKHKRHQLDWLEAFLKEENKKARTALLAHLQTAEFLAVFEDIVAACRRSEAYKKRARGPILALIRAPMKARWRRLVEEGRAIAPDTPPRHYHRLRIDVKKMRYMLEFFLPALDEASAGETVEKLKALQSVLGDHQDLEVQRDFLKRLAKRASLEKEEQEAIRLLDATMAELAEEKRADFFKAFKPIRREKGVCKRLVCRRGGRT